jgi:hypothetical protein
MSKAIESRALVSAALAGRDLNSIDVEVVR